MSDRNSNQNEPRASATAETDLSSLTYLIIDDNKFSRTLIRNALASFGLRRTVEAADAVEGLAVLRKLPIDVVLVDYEMPMITGIEFTKLARRDADIPNQEIPIIMISGYTDREKVIEARNSGVHEYLAKPFTPEHLYRHIANTVLNPRPFIRCKTYVGPERRWLNARREEAQERRHDPETGEPAPAMGQVA